MALDVALTATDKDANSNLKVALPLAAAQAGYAILAGSLADATDPSGLLTEKVRMSTQGRLTVGSPVLLLNEIFNNTALNSAMFGANVTTMTVTVAGGTLNLNASALTTVNAVARVTTFPFFPFQADFATYAVWDAMLTQTPQTGAVVEMGYFQASGTTAPTDGIFFRYDAVGNLKCVVNTNGTEVTSAALAIPSVNTMHKYRIVVENDRSLFYIDGVCQAIIAAPTALGYPLYAAAQPFSFRTYNSSTPSLANTLKVGYLFCGLQDAIGLGKENATIAAIQGRMAAQGQTGQTMGSSALYGNNLAPGAGAAASNNSAALGSGLGGQFSLQPTLTANTDGIISSFQNPLATAAITGKTLYIRGVRIQGLVTTAFTGGPVLMALSLAFGHTSVSMATSESGTSKAPRRIPLGWENYPVTSAVGQLGSAQPIEMKFNAPIAVNPGEFLAVIGKNVGTVTSAGVIAYLIAFDGYWE